MIGEVWSIRTPYYDKKTHSIQIKSRPAVIIAKADSDDYVVLPLSKVTDKSKVDPIYDVTIDPLQYPALNLRNLSYVRTHKQTVAYAADMGHLIGNIKADYEDLFFEILEKRDEFSKSITDQALQ